MAEEKAAPESSGSAPSAGNKLVTILTLVNVLATLGMGAVLFISFQRDRDTPAVQDIVADAGHGDGKGPAAPGDAKGPAQGGAGPAEAKKPADFGKMVTLEQFTVNLATPGSVNPRFVRVNISLEVPTDDAEAEVNQKMPQVRNAIIDLFNSKRPADLATAEGRDYLKEEIRTALNGFMVTGKVKGVFFTNFAVAG